MLELVNLKKTYVTKAGQNVACNGISLKFADKGLVFITGKSGCGKTTLLNLIGGLDNFDSGDIIIDGKKFSEFSPADYDSYRNTLVGFVFQEYNLLNEYSVEKNINIANELQGKKDDQDQIKELLEVVEIGGYEQRKPNQLSGGQKQRVAIARALVKNPKIVLADEPTGALDSVTGIQVMELLKKLSKDKLIIVVSHENEFAEKYADRVIRIVDGQVVEDITLNDVEIKENVFETEEEIIVKSGTRLNEKETESLLCALENNRKINVTEKITVRKKEKTAVIEGDNKSEPVSFIKSKMKFKSVASLGAKSLVVKPIRLIITILLSVIAFAVFGVFDSVASYNGERALTNLLRTADYSAISVTAKYDGGNYDKADIKLTQNYINSLNARTGYSFRGVYDFIETDKIKDSSRPNQNGELMLEDLNFTGASSAAGRRYYLRTLSGIVEFKDSEIVNKVVAPNEFNYRIVHGNYPTLNLDPESNQGVGISNYLADSIMYWLGNKQTKVFGEKEINRASDLIGAQLKFIDHDTVFTIEAIIDCGSVPAKYDKLKNASKENEHLNLAQDYTTFLNASANLLLFMPDGYVSAQRQSANRITSYVANYRRTEYRGILRTKGIDRGSSNSNTYKNKTDYFYYNVNEFNGTNTIFFKDLEQEKAVGMTPQLADNEILIHARDLDLLFAYDYDQAKKKEGVNASHFYSLLGSIDNTTLSLSQKRQNVKNILDMLKEIHDDAYNITNSWVMQIKLQEYYENVLQEGKTKTLNVVGVYFDVNTADAEPSNSVYSPFVMSTDGLKSMGISLEQGIYARAIAGLTDNYRGSAKLGSMLTQENGLHITWYKNGILEVLNQNAEFLDQFLELFLYVAIVVVLFSVFMLMNYITASIASKRQSIGVLRALGTRGKSIFEMFLIESLIIALINGVLACVVGYVASIIVNNYLLEVMNLTVSFVLFGIRQIAIILSASFVTGLLSSILPIIKIVKEKPVALIRKD